MDGFLGVYVIPRLFQLMAMYGLIWVVYNPMKITMCFYVIYCAINEIEVFMSVVFMKMTMCF